MADSGQCMAKTTTICKVISLQLIKINEKKSYIMFIEYLLLKFSHFQKITWFIYLILDSNYNILMEDDV